MNNENRILKENLMIALNIAIKQVAAQELKAYGPNFKSCQRAAWEDNLERLKNDETLIIVYES